LRIRADDKLLLDPQVICERGDRPRRIPIPGHADALDRRVGKRLVEHGLLGRPCHCDGAMPGAPGAAQPHPLFVEQPERPFNRFRQGAGLAVETVGVVAPLDKDDARDGFCRGGERNPEDAWLDPDGRRNVSPGRGVHDSPTDQRRSGTCRQACERPWRRPREIGVEAHAARESRTTAARIENDLVVAEHTASRRGGASRERAFAAPGSAEQEERTARLHDGRTGNEYAVAARRADGQ
jgi:hypothetical protein